MRILRSIRVWHVLVLLLAYSAWVGLLSWLMPYEVQARFTFQVTGKEIQDISPDGRMITIRNSGYGHGRTSFEQEYWDITTGKRIEDTRSELLKRFFSDVHEQSPYAWDVPLGEKLVEFGGSIQHWPRSDYDHFFGKYSESGRYYGYSVNGTKAVFTSKDEANGAIVFDVQNAAPVAQLKGDLNIVAIAPDGRTAVTEAYYREGLLNRPPARKILWDLKTRMPIGELERSEEHVEETFYSADSQYVFTRVCNWTTVDRFTWWRTDGQLVRDVVCPTGTDSGSSMQVLSGNGSSQVLVDSDHILVTYYSGDEFEWGVTKRSQHARHEFWDVATGQKLGEWRRGDKSEIIRQPDMISSRDGRYVGIFCEREPANTMTGWRNWLAKVKSWLGASKPDGYEYHVIVLDALEQKLIARVPAHSARFSRDGSVLVTKDHGTVSVYDLPFRKPWGRIAGFAAIGALATCGAFAGLRRLIRWIL
ncbi:MAG TPA: hypothetical protein VKS79_04130 [Gemmataceae bacterium]|nr:hypothetical protein [Gemmataceae bacterium]